MRIVQVGTGGWGKNHARILSELGVLGAVCDANPDLSREYGSEYSVNHYTDLEEMIKSEEFDGAFVVTPTHTHAEITTKLLNLNKHVFVEKPLTYDVQEGISLMQLAAKRKVLLTCGYIERFNPAVNTIKHMARQKKYGDLIMLEFHRENRIPVHINDVGIIYDTSVHDIDTANWLFDAMPNVVFARAGNIRREHEDFATIMLGYGDDRVAIISSNWITPKRVRRFEAVFVDAIARSDFITQDVVVEYADGKDILTDHKAEPLLLEIVSFLDAIRGGQEHRVKAQEAVNVTKIARAALLSSKKGIPVYLDLRS